MPKQRTEHPWSKRLVEVLRDGEWHDYGDVVKEASQEVPDELAYNKAEYYREYHYRRRGLEPASRRYGDKDDTIRTGQRFIVSKAIQQLKRRGEVEVLYEQDSSGRTRKRPSKIRYTG